MTLSTLEVLYAARATLSDENKRFCFPDWTACTCGHIYAASTGSVAETEGAVAWKRDGDYAEHIEAVARALGWNEFCRFDAPKYISEDTFRMGMGRSHALATIDRAIAAIEAQQEQDRLDVLAQARAVVDSVEVRDEVPA